MFGRRLIKLRSKPWIKDGLGLGNSLCWFIQFVPSINYNSNHHKDSDGSGSAKTKTRTQASSQTGS
jgi:hypothetical protein